MRHDLEHCYVANHLHEIRSADIAFDRYSDIVFQAVYAFFEILAIKRYIVEWHFKVSLMETSVSSRQHKSCAVSEVGLRQLTVIIAKFLYPMHSPYRGIFRMILLEFWIVV